MEFELNNAAAANQAQHPLYLAAGSATTERADDNQDRSENDEFDGAVLDQLIEIHDLFDFWSTWNATDERRPGVIAGQRYDTDDQRHQAQHLYRLHFINN